MECRNHPTVAAVDRCAGCAESFCSECLVEIHGQKYCGACKVLAVQNVPYVPEAATQPCKEASEALIYAIIGLFCVGFILGPIAVYKAIQAKKLMAANPNLTGSGKATAAMVIGVLDLIFSIIGIVTMRSGMLK